MLLYVSTWWALLTAVVWIVCFYRWRSGRRWVVMAGKWGCIIGFTGLALGELSACVWTPDANQGFLFGIFVTGPIAFAATVTTLLVMGAIRARRAAAG